MHIVLVKYLIILTFKEALNANVNIFNFFFRMHFVISKSKQTGVGGGGPKCKIHPDLPWHYSNTKKLNY